MSTKTKYDTEIHTVFFPQQHDPMEMVLLRQSILPTLKAITSSAGRYVGNKFTGGTCQTYLSASKQKELGQYIVKGFLGGLLYKFDYAQPKWSRRIIVSNEGSRREKHFFVGKVIVPTAFQRDLMRVDPDCWSLLAHPDKCNKFICDTLAFCRRLYRDGNKPMASRIMFSLSWVWTNAFASEETPFAIVMDRVIPFNFSATRTPVEK